jgi:hypothetical protein
VITGARLLLVLARALLAAGAAAAPPREERVDENLQKMEEQAQLGLAAGEEVHNVPIGKLASDLKSDLSKGLTSPYAMPPND